MTSDAEESTIYSTVVSSVYNPSALFVTKGLHNRPVLI